MTSSFPVLKPKSRPVSVLSGKNFAVSVFGLGQVDLDYRLDWKSHSTNVLYNFQSKIKSLFHSLNYAKAYDELAGSIFASLRPSNTAVFEKCHENGEPFATPCPIWPDQKWTSDPFKYERFIVRLTDCNYVHSKLRLKAFQKIEILSNAFKSPELSSPNPNNKFRR